MNVEFIIVLNMVKDKRVPRKLRGQVFRLPDGSSGILGAAEIPERAGERSAVFVDISAISGSAREIHASFLSMLFRTIDHEYAHVIYQSPNTSKGEEQMALRFEAAGAWVRR